jgi:hypothetical protein
MQSKYAGRGRAAGKRWRPRPYRRPWIFGPWSAPPWALPPPEPAPEPDAAAPPDEPAPPPPDEPAPPEGGDAPPEELEVWRTVPTVPGQVVRIAWTPVITIAGPRRSLPGVAGGGIYLVVDKADAPLYVGQTGSFAGRWAGRSIGLAQLGLPQPCCPVRVYFGKLTADSATRMAVEHTVIRTLVNGGLGAALTNRSSRAKFRVRTGVRFENVLPAPLVARVRFSDPRRAAYYRGNAIDIPDGATYEIAVG